MEGVLERQFDLVFDVAAGTLACASRTRARPAASLAAEPAAAAEEGGEEVGERVLVSEHALHLFLGHRPEAALRGAAGVDVPAAAEWIGTRGAGLLVHPPVRAEFV